MATPLTTPTSWTEHLKIAGATLALVCVVLMCSNASNAVRDEPVVFVIAGEEEKDGTMLRQLSPDAMIMDMRVETLRVSKIEQLYHIHTASISCV